MTRYERCPVRVAERAINLLDAGRTYEARDLLATLLEEATDLAYQDGMRAAGQPAIKIAHPCHETLQ